jgi:hypothetical protein
MDDQLSNSQHERSDSSSPKVNHTSKKRKKL